MVFTAIAKVVFAFPTFGACPLAHSIPEFPQRLGSRINFLAVSFQDRVKELPYCRVHRYLLVSESLYQKAEGCSKFQRGRPRGHDGPAVGRA